MKSQLTLKVVDNVIGFNLNETKKNNKGGIGLLSLKQRVSALDGSSNIKSSKKKGTSITATINI